MQRVGLVRQIIALHLTHLKNSQLFIPIKAQSTCAEMEYEELVSFVNELPGGPYAVLGAVIVGLVGAIGFCYAVGCGSSKKKQEGEKRRSSESDSAGEGEEPSSGKSKQQGRGKGSKSLKQQSSKKVTLPPHPLLAAEFKGHTGSVLSLDFDVNGKFLASCSDGRLLVSYILVGIMGF